MRFRPLPNRFFSFAPSWRLSGPGRFCSCALEKFVARLPPAATGPPILITEAAEVVRQSFAQAVVITAIAIIAIVAIVRRRFADIVLILTPLVLACVWTVAAVAVFDLTFNFANVIVIPVLLGVGVASSIHVVSRSRELGTQTESGGNGFLDSSTPRSLADGCQHRLGVRYARSVVTQGPVQLGTPARPCDDTVVDCLADSIACHSHPARPRLPSGQGRNVRSAAPA
jgi:hypothetical protein